MAILRIHLSLCLWGIFCLTIPFIKTADITDTMAPVASDILGVKRLSLALSPVGDDTVLSENLSNFSESCDNAYLHTSTSDEVKLKVNHVVLLLSLAQR